MALTPQRVKERQSGLGGSDAAAALGQSPWKTPYKLWREKTGLDAEENLDEVEAAEWGSLLEDTVANKWSRVSGMRVQRVNGLLRHPLQRHMIANIDRAVVNPAIAGRVVWNGKRLTTDAILEVKTSLSGWQDDKWGDEGTDQIPTHYLLQAMHYLFVTGCEVCPFGLLLAGPRFRRYQVRRDTEVIDMMVDAETAFWRMVETRTPPEATTLEDVRLRHPTHIEGLAVEATPEVVGAFTRYAAAKRIQSEQEVVVTTEQLTLMRFMGDAETLTIQGIPALTFRKSKDGEKLDLDALKRDMPSLYKDYLLEKTGSRRMLIK
jgi:putative phage-type endonuclease